MISAVDLISFLKEASRRLVEASKVPCLNSVPSN